MPSLWHPPHRLRVRVPHAAHGSFVLRVFFFSVARLLLFFRSVKMGGKKASFGSSLTSATRRRLGLASSLLSGSEARYIARACVSVTRPTRESMGISSARRARKKSKSWSMGGASPASSSVSSPSSSSSEEDVSMSSKRL